ncbi:aspartate aminotransferase family protein [Vibrio sp. S4M6]|uniref:aspartate aminotransferase family protein n=1 Tax=Vibrio sinus TaxID=2946865 RepID=UPI00202AC206|nr:aspartate aminotransferase family protein [Vibrio sinus]MCL9780608.1 aspartate aminotransferase family protein [Vibrio sinus]
MNNENRWADAYWMPYTSNRQFKSDPRMIVGAQGSYYIDDKNRKVFDGLSGLWTCGAGHNRSEITQAVTKQLQQLDYAPAFQHGHPKAFELAENLAELAPGDINKAFFVNSGSEATDTATKIARAYWRLQGQPSKTRIIGRSKGYHGASWGGVSFGGIGANRKLWGPTLETDHLSHTMNASAAFTKGMSPTGAELADELLELIALHDASNIAAVIVEPFSGSAGVIIPPEGYLQRLKQICAQHNILLIFDEVITAFGRTGHYFGSQAFGVTPDMICVAKQITNGVIPLGAVLTKDNIYDVFMHAGGAQHNIELPHGYTYSGHPVSCAAALATLDLLEKEQLICRVADMAPVFERAVHDLKGTQHIYDIRNYGFAAGISLSPRGDDATIRPAEIARNLWDKGFYVRHGGDTLQLGLPFTTQEDEINRLIDAMGEAINTTA